ncbi:MAG: serine/threonine protein kinase [Planctomycetaceae bacterium]|nr:serine/threonine protein kinase [Planctomycetaceae bacterium]
MNEADNPESDDSLSEVLAAYLQGIDSGNHIDREHLLAKHPECATALLAFFQGEEQIESLSYLLTPLLEKDQPARQSEQPDRVYLGETPRNNTTDPVGPLGTTIAAPQSSRTGSSEALSQVPDDYEILEEISRGGMGVVYKARQRSLNRIVALKVIRADKHAGETTIKRFRAEAEAAASLQHPNIVAIYEFGKQDGQYFYSMKYIEGTSLSELIRESPLSARDAAQFLVPISRAIDYAHAHREPVYHRDLKPSNILIDTDRVPHVTDFGVAKRPNLDSDLTDTGEVLGTPSYMSPEQTFGLPLSPSSDVYSLGATLYSLLTTRPPFQSDTAVDTMLQVRGVDPIAPRRLNSTVPHDLDTICLKCLEKNPYRRYQTAGQLADDLQRFLDGKPIQARPVGRIEKGWRWCLRNRLVAALILMVALSLLGGAAVASVMYVREAEALADTRETLSRMYLKEANLEDPANMMQTLPWLAASLRLDETNPKREPVARVRIASALQSCASLEQMWFHDASSEFSTFSPDGKSVLTVSADKTARVWDVETGQPLTDPLVHTGQVNHGAFSHDGKYIATACLDGIAQVWDLSTGQTISTLHHDVNPKNPNLPGQVMHVRFRPLDPANPDQLIVATASLDDTARVWDARTGKQLAQLTHGGQVEDVLFDPTGRLLVTASYDESARIWDWNTAGDEENKEPLILQHYHNEFVESLAISPDGERVITGSGLGNVRIWDIETGEQLTERPIKHPGVIEDIACSPDGNYFATATDLGIARVWNLWTGLLTMEIPFAHKEEVWSLAFTPDSRQLATGSWDGKVGLWDVATGSHSLPIIPHSGRVYHVEFAPDVENRPQLLTSCDDGTVRLWKPPAEPTRTELPYRSAIHTFAKSTETDRLLLASQEIDISISICDVKSNGTMSIRNFPVIHEKIGHRNSITCADISADGRLAATGGHDNFAIVWDLATNHPITPQLEHVFQIQQVEISRHNHYLLVVDHDLKGNRNATCWEIDAPQEPLWTTSGNFWTAVISPDESLVALADDNSLILLDAVSGKTIETDIRHEGTIFAARFSPDSRLLFTGSVDGTGQLWKMPTGKPHGQPMEHFGGVVKVVFDQTGERLVTASRDGTARVWETATGLPLSQRLPHNSEAHENGNNVDALAFSPDGRFLLTTGSNPNVTYLWSTATGELAMPLSLSSRDVAAAVFGQQGDVLITLHQQRISKQTQRWLQYARIPTDDRTLESLDVTIQLHSNHHIDDLSDLVPCTTDKLRQLRKTVCSQN